MHARRLNECAPLGSWSQATAHRLVTDDAGAVVGVEYDYEGTRTTEYGPVVSACGGTRARAVVDTTTLDACLCVCACSRDGRIRRGFHGLLAAKAGVGAVGVVTRCDFASRRRALVLPGGGAVAHDRRVGGAHTAAAAVAPVRASACSLSPACAAARLMRGARRTTNGPHCTGDGIKMALAVGARSADLHYVQVRCGVVCLEHSDSLMPCRRRDPPPTRAIGAPDGPRGPPRARRKGACVTFVSL